MKILVIGSGGREHALAWAIAQASCEEIDTLNILHATMLAMRRAGHATIAQDEASSAVYGMPRAAAELGAAEQILPLGKISAALSGKIGSPP